MFTTKPLDIVIKGQKQEAIPNTSKYQLGSRDPTRMSSFSYSFSNEDSQERQFDTIEEQRTWSVTRLNIQDTHTNINDREPDDMLDSDSSDSTNLPSFRCILNKEDPDLNNPNLYNCKTCRKGLIHIRSRRLFPNADHCDELPFENNQSRKDFEKNPQNHERYQIKTQKFSSASNTVPTIFSAVKHPPMEFDNQQRSSTYHLQDGVSKINLDEENEVRLVSSVCDDKTKVKAGYPFKCKQCPKQFRSKEGLENHTLVHGAQAKFICDFCSKGFMEKCRLRVHLKVHDKNIESKCPFKCNKCRKRFATKTGMKNHMIVHGAPPKFICELCQIGFVFKSFFERHSRIHKTDVEFKCPFKCNKCRKRFATKTGMKNHMIVHGAPPKFICELCQIGFVFKSLFERHSRIHKTDVESKCPFKCNKCWKRFATKTGMKIHMIVHGAPPKFICELCQKGFLYESGFEKHSRIHKTDVEAKCPFKCNKCSKQFSSKANVVQHTMLHHEAQAKYFCDFCSKGFMVKSHLRQHLKVHKIKIDPNLSLKCS